MELLGVFRAGSRKSALRTRRDSQVRHAGFSPIISGCARP